MSLTWSDEYQGHHIRRRESSTKEPDLELTVSRLNTIIVRVSEMLMRYMTISHDGKRVFTHILLGGEQVRATRSALTCCETKTKQEP